MSTVASVPNPVANIATPSPTPNIQPSPRVQASSHNATPNNNNNAHQHHQRREVACVFVVEGTARMGPHLNTIIQTYVDPILRYIHTYICILFTHFTTLFNSPPKSKTLVIDCKIYICNFILY